LLRGPALASLLMLGVLLLGTLGFAAIEGWSLWDAFYMTLTTVTTIGYREVHDLSPAGRAFNIVVIIVGVSTVLYTFSLLMALVVEGELHDRWEGRRRERMQNQLTQHFILCGFGRIGSVIAEQFRRQRVPFLIVESSAARAKDATDAGYLAVAGDATTEDLLKRSGIDRARGLIAAVGTDAENVYIVLTARLLRPDLFIVGRAESEEAQRKLMRAGADRVISPYHIGALQIAQTALRPAVVDFVQLATSSENLELAMEQVKLGGASELAGRTIVQANLRQRFHAIVVAIQRANGHMEFNPSPDAVMGAGDHLVVLGPPDSLRELELIAGRRGAANA
jgi:voltage-gated potassium channel